VASTAASGARPLAAGQVQGSEHAGVSLATANGQDRVPALARPGRGDEASRSYGRHHRHREQRSRRGPPAQRGGGSVERRDPVAQPGKESRSRARPAKYTTAKSRQNAASRLSWGVRTGGGTRRLLSQAPAAQALSRPGWVVASRDGGAGSLRRGAAVPLQDPTELARMRAAPPARDAVLASARQLDGAQLAVREAHRPECAKPSSMESR